jgi:iron-sulfur cluster insertion protein
MVRIAFEDPAPLAPTDMLSVTMTDAAAARIATLLKENGQSLYLRVGVNGGGCSGYSYAFKFDTQRNPDDIAVEKNGVTVLIDLASFQFLKGSSLDFVETLEASQFVIKNPNATASCGCGNSFSL